eukprot:gene6957-4923_t
MSEYNPVEMSYSPVWWRTRTHTHAPSLAAAASSSLRWINGKELDFPLDGPAAIPSATHAQSKAKMYKIDQSIHSFIPLYFHFWGSQWVWLLLRGSLLLRGPEKEENGQQNPTTTRYVILVVAYFHYFLTSHTPPHPGATVNGISLFSFVTEKGGWSDAAPSHLCLRDADTVWCGGVPVKNHVLDSPHPHPTNTHTHSLSLSLSLAFVLYNLSSGSPKSNFHLAETKRKRKRRRAAVPTPEPRTIKYSLRCGDCPLVCLCPILFIDFGFSQHDDAFRAPHRVRRGLNSQYIPTTTKKKKKGIGPPVSTVFGGGPLFLFLRRETLHPSVFWSELVNRAFLGGVSTIDRSIGVSIYFIFHFLRRKKKGESVPYRLPSSIKKQTNNSRAASHPSSFRASYKGKDKENETGKKKTNAKVTRERFGDHHEEALLLPSSPSTVRLSFALIVVGAQGPLILVGAQGPLIVVGAQGPLIVVGAQGPLILVGAQGPLILELKSQISLSLSLSPPMRRTLPIGLLLRSTLLRQTPQPSSSSSSADNNNNNGSSSSDHPSWVAGHQRETGVKQARPHDAHPHGFSQPHPSGGSSDDRSSASSIFQAFSPLDALRPTPLPIAGDAQPFVRSGSAGSSTVPAAGHCPPAEAALQTATAGASSKPINPYTASSSSSSSPSSSAAAAMGDQTAMLRDALNSSVSWSAPPHHSYTSSSSSSPSTPSFKSEIKRKTKKTAMKLSSLLVNHHHVDVLGSTASSAAASPTPAAAKKPAASALAPIRSLFRDLGGASLPAAPIASTAKPYTAPSAAAADRTHRSHSPASNYMAVHPSATDAAPHAHAPGVDPARRVRTGLATSSVSPAVLKAQAAIAAAAAAKMKKEREAAASAPPAAAAATTTTVNTTGDMPRSSHGSNACKKVYTEHRLLGWSPTQLYAVVSDVRRYHEFLPWCVASVVHTQTPLKTAAPVADPAQQPTEMTASLTVGFALFTEEYTSCVTLMPHHRVIARLHDPHKQQQQQQKKKKPSTAPPPQMDRDSSSSTGLLSSFIRRAARSLPGAPFSGSSSGKASGGGGRHNPILRELHCEWELIPNPKDPRTVEVNFLVSFEFRHPMYAQLIMSNIVSLMTGSFERRCETLFGPASQPSRSLSSPFKNHREGKRKEEGREYGYRKKHKFIID